jgi:undecaprenol kinase
MPMDLKDKKQVEKNKSFIQSLEFALTGWKTVYQDERNFRTHLRMSLLVIVFGFIFQLTIGEWLWLVGVIFLVLFAEMLNTTFENIVDMVTDHHFHPLGKKIKDVAAGAVLLTACFAVIVGALIFIPKMIQLFLP